MTSGKGAEDFYGSSRTAFAVDYNCPVMSILISTSFAELSILLKGKKFSSQIKYFEMGSSIFFFLKTALHLKQGVFQHFFKHPSSPIKEEIVFCLPLLAWNCHRHYVSCTVIEKF